MKRDVEHFKNRLRDAMHEQQQRDSAYEREWEACYMDECQIAMSLYRCEVYEAGYYAGYEATHE